jgi:two-component system sensor histidine kinase/response regulator
MDIRLLAKYASGKLEVGMRKSEKGEGSDVKSEIRNPKSKIKSVPIIAMTAHAMAGDDKKSIEAGMNGHITKPIDPDQLFATLQKWIKPAAERTAVQKTPVNNALFEPDRAGTNEGELPESLPGFDLAAGLERLMGNKRLYRKLLVDFGKQYTEAASDIREALDVKDFNRTHSLIHNLKGLSGNLEATDLQAATVAMEMLVKGKTAKTASDKELNRNFAELENALEQTLTAVQSLGGLTAEKKTIVSRKNARGLVPPELIKKATESIKMAVEMGDVMKLKSLAEELESQSDAMEPFCSELVQMAENFDFDGIQRFMREFDN